VNRVLKEEPKHSVISEARKPRAEKAKNANVRRQDPHIGKPMVLIGVPLNGKRFWIGAERFHTPVDAWQAKVRENYH